MSCSTYISGIVTVSPFGRSQAEKRYILTRKTTGKQEEDWNTVEGRESRKEKIMTKKIIYTDEFGNKIDVNTIQGIHTIINDVLASCETESACLCVRENIKASAEKCCKTRIQELKTDKSQDKSIW